MPYVDKQPQLYETISGVQILIIGNEAQGQCVACRPAPKWMVRKGLKEQIIEERSSHKGRQRARELATLWSRQGDTQ
jgi:hypothetical protein